MILEKWPNWVKTAVFEVTGIGWCIRLLNQAEAQSSNKVELIEYMLHRNKMQIELTGELEHPADQGCLFVANHPHGFLDGLILIWLGCKFGFDTRAVTRHYTSVFTPIKELLFFAKTDNQRATTNGQQVVEQAAEFVAQGGALSICAAGRIAEAKPFWTEPKEVDWKTGTARIAAQSKAPIVLVHIDIDPSLMRQVVHVVNPVLRNLIQIWVYLLGKKHTLKVHVLERIEHEQIPAGDAKAQTLWLRDRYEQAVAKLN